MKNNKPASLWTQNIVAAGIVALALLAVACDTGTNGNPNGNGGSGYLTIQGFAKGEETIIKIAATEGEAQLRAFQPVGGNPYKVYYDGTLIDEGTLVSIVGETWKLKSGRGNHETIFTLINSLVSDMFITPVVSTGGLTAGTAIDFYPHGIDNGTQELVFPPITGQTTGITGSVTFTDIPLQPGYGMDKDDNLIIATKDDIPDIVSTTIKGNTTDEDIGTFSVSGGKLSFSLKTSGLIGSTISDWVNSGTSEAYKWFGNTSGNAVTISPSDAKVIYADTLKYGVVNAPKINRELVVQEEAFAKASGITYIWVDKDCTLSRGATSMFFTTGDYQDETVDFSAFNLPLKAGWNLVQINRYQYSEDGRVITLKIADSNVPWSVGFDD